MTKREFVHKADLIDKEDLKEELQEFRKFALKKNMLELAVAFILGGAFQKLVTGISEGFFMPIINSVLSHTGTAWRETTWELGNVSIETGKLGGLAVDFFITALVLYILFVKILKPMWAQEAPKEKSKPIPISIRSKKVH